MPRIKYGKGQGDVLTRSDALVFPCLRANGGGLMKGLGLLIPEATKQGYAIDMKAVYPNSTRGNPIRGDGNTQVLDHNCNIGVPSGSRIRRLTPTECERLQGFDNIEKYVILKVCLDHQKNSVSVEQKNHKLPSCVGVVEKTNISEIVLSVENNLDLKHPLINKLAPQNVLIKCGESTVEILNQGKSLLSVSNVTKKRAFHQHISIEDFALLNVGLYSMLERIMLSGKAGSHQRGQCLILQENGLNLVRLFGSEITLNAVSAEIDLTTLKELLKFTTSSRLFTENLEQRLITLSSFVIRVISGFIPPEILNQNTFTIILQSNLGWTFGISSSQRYKALGNAVTVDVVCEIAKRLKV